jgi:hypothetical protein
MCRCRSISALSISTQYMERSSSLLGACCWAVTPLVKAASAHDNTRRRQPRKRPSAAARDHRLGRGCFDHIAVHRSIRHRAFRSSQNRSRNGWEAPPTDLRHCTSRYRSRQLDFGGAGLWCATCSAWFKPTQSCRSSAYSSASVAVLRLGPKSNYVDRFPR